MLCPAKQLKSGFTPTRTISNMKRLQQLFLPILALLVFTATSGWAQDTAVEEPLIIDFNERFLQGTQVVLEAIPVLNGSDYIVLTPNQNLAILTDLLSDLSTFKFGMDQYERNVWGTADFKFGCGVRNITQVKVHTLNS